MSFGFNGNTFGWLFGGKNQAGGGSVTSVGLTMPTSDFDVSGSPITSNGTLAVSYKSQSPNLVFASPNISSGVPSFRALVATDLPTDGYDTRYVQLSGAYANPTWITSLAYSKLTGAPSSLPPSGSAGGDLGGTYPNPTVTWANGYPTYDARYVQLSGSYADPSWITSLAYSKLTGTPSLNGGYALFNYYNFI